jgi:hypothetical protein
MQPPTQTLHDLETLKWVRGVDAEGPWIKQCFRPDALNLVFGGEGAVMETTPDVMSPSKETEVEPPGEDTAAKELVRLAREWL